MHPHLSVAVLWFFLNIFAEDNKRGVHCVPCPPVENEKWICSFLWFYICIYIYVRIHFDYIFLFNSYCWFISFWSDPINLCCILLLTLSVTLLSKGLSCAPRSFAPPTRVCAPVTPTWTLRHWPESLKSLLHMAFKEKWHRVSVRLLRGLWALKN